MSGPASGTRRLPDSVYWVVPCDFCPAGIDEPCIQCNNKGVPIPGAGPRKRGVHPVRRDAAEAWYAIQPEFSESKVSASKESR